jgi:hypothetical protein
MKNEKMKYVKKIDLDWDNIEKDIKYIWEVGITIDFDVIGYVYASNKNEAMNLALQDKYIKKHEKFNIRVNKLTGYKQLFLGNVSTEESYHIKYKRLLKIAIRASHNIEQFNKCFDNWKQDNNLKG